MLLNHKCTYFPASLQEVINVMIMQPHGMFQYFNIYVPLPRIMKRIILLSDINSAHTKKWVTVLLNEGFTIGVFSLSEPTDNWYTLSGVELLSCGGFETNSFNKTTTEKLSYLGKRQAVRETIKKFQPDILHAHYASSYGLLGAMSGFHPYFISVWGSDVLLFPNNLVSKSILKYNFRKADKIIVSSKTLDTATRQFTKKTPVIIPFGIDTTLFAPADRSGRKSVTIGTVKSLRTVYGIDLLIRAFAKVVSSLPESDISLTIVGEGPERENLTNLAASLGVDDMVTMLPPVSQDKLVPLLHSFDIVAFLSRSESFGVAVLEASSTGLPVVVSKTGGLTEVVDHEITGFHTEPGNIDDAAEKLVGLINDPDLRKRMGTNGRDKVLREYELKNTIKDICRLYSEETTR